MSSGKSKSLRLGLRARLTLWMTLMLAASLGTGFAWVHYGLRGVLESKNDASLERKSTEMAALVRDTLSGGQAALEAEISREVTAYKDEGLVVVVRRPGALLAAPPRERSHHLADLMASAALGTAPQTVKLPGTRERYRVVRIDLVPPWEAGSSLDMGLSLTETETIVGQFDRRVAAGALAFLGLAALGGLLFSRQALRPVAQSIRTAKRLNPQNLTARLPRTGADDELDQLAGTINDLLDRLRQLVTNLVDNAIKFTPEGGTVTLIVEKTGIGAKLTVSDTGAGIPEEDLPHIFDRFYQVSRARSSEGYGLGLSICKWIVDAHGGSIRAESEQGKGATFMVFLPAIRPAG